jgi:hypothetical protein
LEVSVKKYFTWEGGRQQSGYGKMLIAESANYLLPFDIYLLKYPEGSEIPEHTDPVPKRRHVRINLVLKKAKRGGMFSCTDAIFGSKRLNIFFSDRPHQVSKIEEGSRLILSIGMLVGRKK